MPTGHTICFVSMEAYPNLRPGIAPEAGGAGFQVVEMARELRARGTPVCFVAGDYGQGFHEVIEGFHVYRANRVAYDRSLVRGIANLWRLFRAMRAARSRHYVLRSTRFLAFFVMVYARLLGAKYTFMVANLPHCLRNELEDLPGLFRHLYMISLKFADHITVQSREQRELFRQNFGIAPDLLPNGIQVPPLASPADSSFDFVWVASFKRQKRADKLIEIARRLPHRRFLVAGGPGPDVEYSSHLMESLQGLPNVEFRGFVPPDRVGEIYRQGRIFLNTSDWEGFPNGFLYAWSRGIPACSLLVDPDRVLSGLGLGLVEPDTTALAGAMDRLLDDRARYDVMAAACYDHVSRHHSLTATVDVLTRLLLGPHPCGPEAPVR